MSHSSSSTGSRAADPAKEGATLFVGGLGRPEHLDRGYYARLTIRPDKASG